VLCFLSACIEQNRYGQAQLTKQGFETFRKQSSAWQKGHLSATEYHLEIVRLGLVSQVAPLMSICPNEAKRNELLAEHVAYVQEGAAHCAHVGAPVYLMVTVVTGDDVCTVSRSLHRGPLLSRVPARILGTQVRHAEPRADAFTSSMIRGFHLYPHELRKCSYIPLRPTHESVHMLQDNK
jgi:hypothetical protein